MTSTDRTKGLMLAAFLSGLGFAGGVQALTLDLDITFSGTSPTGMYSATFSDTCGADCVRLTMSTSGATGEFIDGATAGAFGWGFNLDPLLDATSLSFSFVSGNDADNIATGTNDFKADGDGFYDIVFSWDPDPLSRLSNGQGAVYDIFGTGLDALDFNFFSACDRGCGTGSFLSAAHVQNIGTGGDSGWIGADNGDGPPPPPPPIGIPEPASLLLVGLGLAGAGLMRRRRVG